MCKNFWISVKINLKHNKRNKMKKNVINSEQLKHKIRNRNQIIGQYFTT